MAVGMAAERIATFSAIAMSHWQNFDMPDIDFQEISYYAAPTKKTKFNSLDEVDTDCWPPLKSWVFL